MKKQLFTLLTLLVMCVTGAWGSTVDDLVEISSNYTFIADDVTDNGTKGLSANTLYDSNRIFSPLGNSYATNKGSSTIDGVSHYNSLRVKSNTQDVLAFKVGGACTLTFYAQTTGKTGNDVRPIKVGNAINDNTYGTITDANEDHVVNITTAGVIYLTGTGDRFIAGFKVTFPKPEITTQPVSTSYQKGATASALTVAATASKGDLNYQWYSCDDEEKTNPATIGGATTDSYTPTTTSNGTFYYFCRITDGNGYSDSNVATITVAEATYPTISVEATATSVSLNAPVTLTGTITGVPEPTIQWYSCDNALKTNATPINGATSTTYVPSTASANTYYFYAVATNSLGSATSDVITLTVNPLYTVTYAIGDGTGVAPAAVGEITKGTSITLPKNFTMYKEGYTMTGWSDGTDTYATGAQYTVNGDVTLTAQYTANTVSLEDRTNATTITFDFRRENGAPTVQWGEGSGAHVWVTQATVAGKTIDVKADINVTADGKVANANWEDWVQINNTTEIAVPSENGAIIKISAYDDKNVTTVNGNTKDSYASQVYTYNVTNDGSIAQIVMGQGEGSAYYKYIEVTLPSKSEVLSATEVNTQFILTKENIDNYDFVSVSTNNWNTGKTYGAYSGDFYNMSSSDRKITMKVTGASSFEVYVQNSNSGRGYTVKIGDNDAVTVNHGAGGLESSGVFTIDDASATTTIVIAGTGSSVYPVYAMFNPAVTATITPTGYATFSSPYALDFSGTIENLDGAYYASAVAPGSVTMTKLNQTVPAETGLFLKGTNGTVTIPVAASGTEINGDNYLKPNTSSSTVAASTENLYHYVFAYTTSDSSNPGFFNLGSDYTLDAGKAYLETTTSIKPAQSQGAKVSILFFDDNLTGVKSIDASSNVNANADKMYNLGGQLVGEGYKGIVIVNGKKIVK